MLQSRRQHTPPMFLRLLKMRVDKDTRPVAKIGSVFALMLKQNDRDKVVVQWVRVVFSGPCQTGMQLVLRWRNLEHACEV